MGTIFIMVIFKVSHTPYIYLKVWTQANPMLLEFSAKPHFPFTLIFMLNFDLTNEFLSNEFFAIFIEFVKFPYNKYQKFSLSFNFSSISWPSIVIWLIRFEITFWGDKCPPTRTMYKSDPVIAPLIGPIIGIQKKQFDTKNQMTAMTPVPPQDDFYANFQVKIFRSIFKSEFLSQFLSQNFYANFSVNNFYSPRSLLYTVKYVCTIKIIFTPEFFFANISYTP